MAQVKKFQNPAGPITETAASTPAGTPAEETKKKYGKWILDGVEYEMDDESMKNFAEHAKNVKNAKDRKFAAEYWKMLQNGEDVIIDSVTNETNVLPKWLGKRAKKKITEDRPQESIFASMFNTKQHQFNRTTEHMAGFNPTAVKEEESTPEKESLLKWTKDKGFEYTALEDGTHEFRSLPNEDNLAYFDKIASYLEGNDEHRAKYDISGWADINNILSWYQKIKDESGENPTGSVWMNNLRTAIVNGSELTQEQKDYLNAIGMGHTFGTNEVVAEQNAQKELNAKKNAAWAKYNTGNLWSSGARDKYFTYDADSDSYSMNTEYLPGTLDANSGYYFNNDFITQFAGEGYDWLKGKIYLNGKWYSDVDLANTQSALYKILNNPSNDYFNKNKRGQYAEANKVMMTTWDGAHNLLPAKSDETAGYVGDFYSNPWLYEATNYMMKGTKYKGDDLNDDYTIRKYVDLSDTNFLDHTGRRNYKWALTDAYGNVIDNNLDVSQLEGIYDWSTDENAQKITPYSRLSTDPNDKYYYNRYAKSTKDENGNTLIEGYFEPNNSKVHASISSELGGDGKNVFLDMPVEVYDVLSNKTFLSSLNARRDLKEKFVNLVGNKTRKGRQITADELMSMNLTPDEATAIIEYFQTHWKDPKTIAKPVGRKHGGVIKAQSGAVVRHAGYNPAQALENATQLNETFVNPYESRVVRKDGEWDFWKDLTPTDKLEMAGLTADLTGMAAGFLPVVGDAANVALSTIGSNILYGIADRRRVKEGAAPKGTTWKNIAMGVGADVASLLPVAGDLANATRWGSRLKDFALKSEPFAKAFTTGLAAYGAIGAIDSYKKLMSGEDLTADEFRELIYGAMSVFGLAGNTKRAIGDAQVAAKTAPKPEALTRTTTFKKADGTDGKVTLDEGQIAKLTHFTAAGDKKSKEMLSQMLRDADVPAEEINRIMGDANALKELGLIREAPKVGMARYTAVKQERTPGALEYWARPVKRTRDLQSRSTQDLFKAADSNPKAVARWVNANEGNASLKWSEDTERHHQSDAGTGVIKWGLYNDSAKWHPGTTSAELKARAEAETRAKENAKAEKLLEKAARAEAAARAKAEAKIAKDLAKKAKADAAAKAKLDADAERQHKAELLARAKSIAAAKKAKANAQKQAEEVAVKASDESLIEPVVEPVVEPVIETIPSFDFEGYRTRIAGTGSASAGEFKKRIGKEFDDKSFQEAAASNPAEARRILTEEIENWAQKQNDKKSLERRKQKLIREIEGMKQKRNLVFKRGGIIKAQHGQNTRNFWGRVGEILKPLGSHEFKQGLISGARYIAGNAATNRNTERSINAVRESARIAQPNFIKENYTPQIINAGNAERAIANNKLKNLPAVTNDPALNLQFQKLNFDEVAMGLGNGVRLDSNQHVENQIRGAEEKRTFTGLNHEINREQKRIASYVPTAISELKNQANTAKTQSGLEYLYQMQQELDQDKNEALTFARATLENDLRTKANTAFEAEKAKYFTESNPFDPTNDGHVTLLNSLYKKYNDQFTTDMKLSQFNMMSPGAQRYYDYNLAFKKSGGSLRSASDQIKINSAKAADQLQLNKQKVFDKNWADNNKEVRKAIGKMSDRVHDLIMKMLS